MNNNVISGALNSVSDRHIRENDIELLTGDGSISGKRRLSIRGMRVMLAAAACAAVLGISLTAGAAATQGFTRTKGYSKDWQQPTVTFAAVDDSNAPTVLKEYYKPQYLPEDMQYYCSGGVNEKNTRYSAVFVTGVENMYDTMLVPMSVVGFYQYTKAEFRATFLTPKYVEVTEITVNGCPGYMLNVAHYYGDVRNVIWDNGDYIMWLSCGGTFEDVMRIAESVAVDENALVFDERGFNP